jgi:hypothetical protein
VEKFQGKKLLSYLRLKLQDNIKTNCKDISCEYINSNRLAQNRIMVINFRITLFVSQPVSGSLDHAMDRCKWCA